MCKLALIISGVIIFGPMEEKAATSGAGLVPTTVIVGMILAIGFLKIEKALEPKFPNQSF